MQHEIDSYDFVRRVKELLSALKPLKTKPNSQLNLTKFGMSYDLSDEKINSLVNFVLHLQSLFLFEFKGFQIQKQWRNGITYLRVISSSNRYNDQKIVRDIYLSSKESRNVLDLIYFYQYVKIGKGFDPRLVHSDLCKKAKKLHSEHPYLIEKRGNGKLYPTSLAINLGNKLRVYIKLNRIVTTLNIEDYIVHIGDEHKNG